MFYMSKKEFTNVLNLNRRNPYVFKSHVVPLVTVTGTELGDEREDRKLPT